jgi:hypothetical protein
VLLEAADPLSGQANLAAVQGVYAGKKIENGGLSRSIRSYQADCRASLDLEGDSVHRFYAAKMFV